MSFHDRRMSVRQAEEAARIAAAKARGRVPEQCGPEIPEAPARGAFRVFEPKRLYPDGKDGYEVRPAGYRGRAAIRNADAFDVMTAAAARRKKPSPFTASQVSMGRHYRDLVERHACAGVKCSSLEAPRSGGSGQGGGFIDAVLRDREEIDRLRRRIGDGVAMEVRRVRPSQRGTRVAIPDRRLVDLVCIEEKTISDVLKAHGWTASGKTVTALAQALGRALDRMAGPVRKPGTATVHYGDQLPVWPED